MPRVILLALFVGFLCEGLSHSQGQTEAFRRRTLTELSSSLFANTDARVDTDTANIQCPPGFQAQIGKQYADKPIENAADEFYAGKQVWCVSDTGTALHWCAFTETALDGNQWPECQKQGYATVSSGYLQAADGQKLQAMVFNMNNAYAAQRRAFFSCPKDWQPKDHSRSSVLVTDLDAFSTMNDVINAQIDDAAICCKTAGECKHWCEFTEKMSLPNHAMYLKCLGYSYHKSDAEISVAMSFERSLQRPAAVFQMTEQSKGEPKTEIKKTDVDNTRKRRHANAAKEAANRRPWRP